MRKPHPESGFIPTERPPGSVDIEDFAQALYAVERALEYGDYGPLHTRARAGKALPDEQALLVDILEKKVKRPPHRAARHPETLRFRGLCLALRVLDYRLKGLVLKAAVMNAAHDAGTKKNAAYAAAKQHRDLFIRCGFSK